MTIPLSTGPTLQQRREGFLVGAVVGAALAAATSDTTEAAAIQSRLLDGGCRPLPPPPGRRTAAVALSDGLFEELLTGGVDLRRLAGRWLEWFRNDGLHLTPGLATALDHLGRYDAPLPAAMQTSVMAVAAAMPAALTSTNPQAMIAGAFHVARLVDPGETTALATVATVVTAARLLDGHRDFIPDVLAVMRSNDAPLSLVEAIARVPRDPRTPPPVPRGSMPDVSDAVSWILWTVHHRPRGAQVLEQMVLSGGVSPAVGAILGGLIGARDGLEQWPLAWTDGSGEDVVLRRALARRLGAPA